MVAYNRIMVSHVAGNKPVKPILLSQLLLPSAPNANNKSVPSYWNRIWHIVRGINSYSIKDFQ